jgi:hypothetical protein
VTRLASQNEEQSIKMSILQFVIMPEKAVLMVKALHFCTILKLDFLSIFYSNYF